MTHIDPVCGGRYGDISLEIGRIEMDTISIVSSIDIVPTILEITGIEKPQNLHGIDVLNHELLMSREGVFGEIYDHGFSTIDSSLQYRLAIQIHISLSCRIRIANRVRRFNYSILLKIHMKLKILLNRCLR